jgi:cytoskeletal protein RodZ
VSELGEFLRKARSERGLSLEDVQESTKIRKRYLEAIEEGKYSILPGTFYARAFIKQYSEAVGLDPEEVLKSYSHEIPAPETETSSEPVRMKRRPVNPPERNSRWASIVLMIAFPLLILGVIYYFTLNGAQPRNNVLENSPLTNQRESQQGEGTGTGDAANGSDGSTVDGAASGESGTDAVTPGETGGGLPGVQEPETTSPPEAANAVEFVEKFRAGGAEAQRYAVKSPGPLKVELKVVGSECWVGIMKDSNKGKYVYQKGLSKDDIFTAEYDHDVFINIGRANALELKINGVLIDTGKDPDPMKFQFDLTPVTE